MKTKLTPEQKAEQRLWKNADKACRALMESMRTPVRIGSLSFNVRDGLCAHMVYNLEIELKVPKKSKNRWQIVDKHGDKSTLSVSTR